MSQRSETRVSVIIPARNEEQNIERVVRSVAGQDPVIEILVVDDASTDQTAEILKRLQDEIPLLRAIRNNVLPEGWAGKPHACALGAHRARGEWLLFTDADTEHLPGSLAYWVEQAEREGLDMVSLSPGQVVTKWWEKAVIPRLFVQLARWYPFEEISRPDSPRAAANGQYFLVRRKVYLEAGGFESVRGQILDDVRLAERVKASGGRICFAPGADWVRTRMYASFRAMWQGWTKNLYLLAEGKWRRGLAAATGAWLLDVVPLAAFVVLGTMTLAARRGSLVTILAAGCLFFALARRARYGRELAKLGFDPRLANYQGPGALLAGLLILNSFCTYRLGWRIEWKGRAYPSAAWGKQG
jgi:chlorobactene glucosyltransferase